MTKKIFSSATILAVVFTCAFLACGDGQKESLEFSETVVTGGPERFMEVRHVVMKGSNYAIGKKLGEIVQRDGIQLRPYGDPLRNKVKREYMALNYPVLYERMKGVAASFGQDIEDDRFDFTNLPQPTTLSLGCSVVFYPGDQTEDGHGLLSRNYDFTTGNIQGQHLEEGEMPVMSRPYILELYPDEGYASIAIHAFEYLGGTIDGINSEGLVVAILAEQESIQRVGREPGNEVGLHELCGMRYLLDNCKDVSEAKQALLSLKHYYTFIPCHYIVADNNGDSFIFEFSPNRNRSHIIEGDGPQCITNHLVSSHMTLEDLPEDTHESFDRYRYLHTAMTSQEKFSRQDIAQINMRVAVPPMAFKHPVYAPGRTIWYAVYDTEAHTLDVRFYLGEEPNPDNEEMVILKYSDFFRFLLLGDVL